MTITQAIHKLFGSKFSFGRGFSKAHDAIDIPAPAGTPIYAVASGTVEYARDARTQADKGAKGWAMGGGNVVDINIGNHMATQYAHMQRFVVHEGQYVTKGQLIGYVGRTGGGAYNAATGQYSSYGGPGSQFAPGQEHVHFALIDHDAKKFVNPTQFLLDAAKDPVAPPVKTKDISLGGFNNLITYPVGHVITLADIGHISDVLSKAGWFDNPIQQVAFEEFMKQNALGKPWSKELQNQLAGQASADATNIGNATDVGGAIAAFGGTLTRIAGFAAGLLIIIVGLFIYSKSASEGSYGQA